MTNSTAFYLPNLLWVRATALIPLGLVILQTLAGQADLKAEEFKISLQSGSVITVDVTNPTLKWTRVSNSGESSAETIQIADLERVILSLSLIHI